MEILGIGAPELIFILLIAIIVLGPRDMQKAGRTIGRWLNQLVNSDGWKALQQTSREIRKLPTNLMREANLDLQETEQALRKGLDIRPDRSIASPASSSLSANRILPPSKEAENSTQSMPPAVNDKRAAVANSESSTENDAVSTNTEEYD